MSVALPAAVQGRRNCCVLTPRTEPPTSLEAERQTPAEEEAAEAAPARGCFTRHPPPPPAFPRLSQNSDPDSREEFKLAEARASARDVKTA